MKLILRWAAASCVVAFLSACGGGGGGGNTSPPTPEGPETTGSTGLVPTASALGAVLEDRATTLRPVIVDAQWQYRYNEFGGTGTRSYTTTATRAITNGVTEVDSDDAGTDSSVTVDEATGSVLVSTSLEISDTNTTPRLRVEGFELRAPVRVNDQWVLLDQRVENSGLDIDGDNIADRMDIAVYRIVVGRESITLPDAATPMDTVRVDSILATRFTPSAGGAAITERQRESSWYGRGIGLVRSVVHASDGAAHEFDSETWLTGFDGVTRGWGALLLPAQISASSVAPGPAYSAARVADGIVVLDAFNIVKLGLDGRLISARTRAAAGLADGYLASTSAGLRLIGTPTFSAYSITRLADDGSRIGTGAVAIIDLVALNEPDSTLLSETFTSHPGGARFWLVWERYVPVSGGTRKELLARSFDPDGQPTSGEILLTVRSGIERPVATATPTDGLVVTWVDGTAGTAVNVQTELNQDGQVLWTSTQQNMQALGPDSVRVWADTAGTWLTWYGKQPDGSYAAYGVRVDDEGRFVGVATNADAFATQRLAAIDADFAPTYSAASVNEGRIHAVATIYGAPFPGDPSLDHHLYYAEFDLGPANAAAGIRETRRLVLGNRVRAPAVPPIVLDDRIILLTDDGSFLAPVIIWR